MNKSDMVDILVNEYGEDREELNNMRPVDVKMMYEATLALDNMDSEDEYTDFKDAGADNMNEDTLDDLDFLNETEVEDIMDNMHPNMTDEEFSEQNGW